MKALELIKYLPAIAQLVRTAEVLIAGQGQGPAKLQFVLDLVADFLPEIADQVESIAKMVARLVALFNKTGEFKTV